MNTPYTTRTGLQIGSMYQAPAPRPTPEEIEVQSVILAEDDEYTMDIYDLLWRALGALLAGLGFVATCIAAGFFSAWMGWI